MRAWRFDSWMRIARAPSSPRLLVAFLAGVTVASRIHFHITADALVGRVAVRKVFVVRNDLGLAVDLQARRAEMGAELEPNQLER